MVHFYQVIVTFHVVEHPQIKVSSGQVSYISICTVRIDVGENPGEGEAPARLFLLSSRKMNARGIIQRLNILELKGHIWP